MLNISAEPEFKKESLERGIERERERGAALLSGIQALCPVEWNCEQRRSPGASLSREKQRLEEAPSWVHLDGRSEVH